MIKKTTLALTLLVMTLAGCEEEPAETGEEITRAVKTHLVTKTEVSTLRRFPSVLEPAELSTLSFEVGGALQEVELSIGQLVNKGDILVRLDPTALEIQLENAQAAVAAAEAEFNNSAKALERQTQLLERGSVTQVAVDTAQTDYLAREAALDQAMQALEAARTDLTKTTLHAPFSGIINSVEVTSFATVGAGSPVAMIYAPDDFEASFSVNFETAGQVVVGTPARVRLADLPTTEVTAVVSEIGQRADTVSAFPVVVSLNDGSPLLKAGMAVEVSLEFPLPETEGVLLPMTAVSTDLSEVGHLDSNGQEKIVVYVFDADAGTVNQRQVEVSGVRGNSLIVTDGLEIGEHVASAGVSFLRDGQKVRLLNQDKDN